MSDTQGAEDTASGGLVNDMPGIGNAPASPRMVPSALGGLAQFAQQALGIGGPAPRAPGPGRSPFQFPGQSQIPVPPGDQNWRGTTASLVLPRGSPQPRASFTPYVGTIPTNDYTKWGQPEEYPNLPQSHEVPPLWGKIGQFFGQQGGMSSPWGMLLSQHAGAYIKGVMQGQEFRAKMERDKALNAALHLQEIEETRHRLIGEIIAKYATEGGTDDPAKLGKFAIRGVTLNDALHQYAIEHDDPDIRQMTEDGVGVQKIWDYQKFRDANLKDLQKTNEKAQQQAEEDAKERKDWGVPDSGATSTRSATDPFSLGAPSQPTAAAGPGGQPAPTMTAAPADPFSAGGQPPTAGGGTPSDQTALQPYQEAGNNVLKGEETIASQPKAVREAVGRWAQQQGGKIDQVIAGAKSGQIKPDQIRAALDKIIPGMGDDYQRVYDGSYNPTGPAGRAPYWAKISTLAIPDPAAQQAAIKDFANTRSGAGARLIAAGKMAPALKTVLEALKKIPENELIPQYVLDQWIAGHVTGDPKYQGLFNALNNYVQEAQALNSPTGRFFVTEVESLKRNFTQTPSTKAVRTFLQQDAENAVGLLDEMRRGYHHITRRTDDPGYYDAHNADVLRATAQFLNPDTGFAGVPEDNLPVELRGLGMGAGVNQDTGKRNTGPTQPEAPDVPQGWGNLR